MSGLGPYQGLRKFQNLVGSKVKDTQPHSPPHEKDSYCLSLHCSNI